jgi:hypothetical protein
MVSSHFRAGGIRVEEQVFAPPAVVPGTILREHWQRASVRKRETVTRFHLALRPSRDSYASLAIVLPLSSGLGAAALLFTSLEWRRLKLRLDPMRDRTRLCLAESSVWYTSSGKRLPSTSAIQFFALQPGRFASAFHRTAFLTSALCGLTDYAVKPFTRGRTSEVICGLHSPYQVTQCTNRSRSQPWLALFTRCRDSLPWLLLH